MLISAFAFFEPVEPAELLATVASLLQLSERSETGIRTETAGTGISDVGRRMREAGSFRMEQAGCRMRRSVIEADEAPGALAYRQPPGPANTYAAA